LFNQSKYTKWYFELISSRRDLIRDCFVEKHHIIPKCLGGTNDKTNLIKLTPREHYICHRLLLEMVDDPNHKRKMAYSLVRMATLNTKDKTQKRINSKQYETIKLLCREHFVGKNNPFYGKGHFGKENPMSLPKNYEKFLHAIRTPEYRTKMSKLFSGEKNPFYGKQHTEKTKKILSQVKSKEIEVLFENGEIIKFSQCGHLGKFLGKSDSLGKKLCSGNFNYLWGKYKIKEISKNDKNSKDN
jgi:hypothetical protein